MSVMIVETVKRSWPAGFQNERWVFLHIQKTGGTSLSRHIEQSLPPESVCSEDNANFEWYDPRELMSFRFFRSHFSWSDIQPIRDLPGATRTFTIMRDPVARAFSLYRYVGSPSNSYNRQINQAHHRYFKRTSLLDILSGSHPKSFRIFSNPVARQFAGAKPVGEGDWDDEAELLDVAMRNLECVDFVGMQHDLPRSASTVLSLMGLGTEQPLPRLNVTSTNYAQSDAIDEAPFRALEPAEIDRLREVTRIDQKIYDHYLTKYEAAYGPVELTLMTSEGATRLQGGAHEYVLCPAHAGAWVVAGPYCSLPAGAYEAAFEVAACADLPVDPARIVATLDVVGHQHEISIAARDLTTADLACAPGEMKRISLPFEIRAPEENMQFRVLSHGGARLLASTRLRLTRVPAAVAQVIALRPKPTLASLEPRAANS